MSIEGTTGTKNYYVYRIDPSIPTVIERKANKRYAKWSTYATYDTAEEAHAAWFKLGRMQKDEAK